MRKSYVHLFLVIVMKKFFKILKRYKSYFRKYKNRPLDEGVLINIGCGNDIRVGWLNCDLFPLDSTVLKLDISTAEGLEWLSTQDASLIECNHVIGYLNYKQAKLFFQSCFDGLAVGGKLILEFPDILKIAKLMIDLNVKKCSDTEYLEIIRAIYAYDIKDAKADSIEFSTYITGWASDFVIRELESIGFRSVCALDPETHARRIKRDSRVEALK